VVVVVVVSTGAAAVLAAATGIVVGGGIVAGGGAYTAAGSYFGTYTTSGIRRLDGDHFLVFLLLGLDLELGRALEIPHLLRLDALAAARRRARRLDQQ
jgi:hypothetical protein